MTISMKHLSIGYFSQASSPNVAGLKAAMMSSMIHVFQYRFEMARLGGEYLQRTRKH